MATGCCLTELRLLQLDYLGASDVRSTSESVALTVLHVYHGSLQSFSQEARVLLSLRVIKNQTTTHRHHHLYHHSNNKGHGKLMKIVLGGVVTEGL